MVKLLVDEVGSAEARELWRAADAAASRLTYPEARAALALARRLGRLSRRYRNAVAELDSLWRDLLVVELDADVARAAGSLAAAHGLSGSDGVQLASVLTLAPLEPVLVAWDRALTRAGLAEGLHVVPAVS